MDLVGWSLAVVDALGGAGIALVLALENLVAMIPGEILLPFVGMLAEQNGYGIWWALGWTTLGSVVGAYVIYAGGRLLGPDRARRLLLKVPLTESADIDRATAFFDRYGAWAVIFVRWIPMLRAFISLPAGTQRMNPLTFGLATAIGSGTWNGVFVVAGYYLGQRGSELINEVVTTYSLVLGIIGAIVVVVLVVRRLRRRRRTRAVGLAVRHVAERPAVPEDTRPDDDAHHSDDDHPADHPATDDDAPAPRPTSPDGPESDLVATPRRHPGGGSVNSS
ncbi:DedA family protein [Georgenia sp. Z1344]|uniref:DedA family protein n=1 Tax=Georgenia sp. Z1344 TaxID=3416706 RepID=UPI003CFA7AAC